VAASRATRTVDERAAQQRDHVPLPHSAQEQELVARFADAFERDLEPLVVLLTEDAWLTMPPGPGEYQGPRSHQVLPDQRLHGQLGSPPPTDRHTSEHPARVRALRQGPAGRDRPRALGIRPHARRQLHLTHHPLPRGRATTTLRTPPNDPLVTHQHPPGAGLVANRSDATAGLRQSHSLGTAGAGRYLLLGSRRRRASASLPWRG
jgi:hypothetical protein